MALSANSVWEIRTAGAATNGGGFVTGASGTDYSQQDAKNTVGNNISTTDAVAVGTAVITSATATVTAAIVGNIIYLQGGTGALAAGWYEVVSQAGDGITFTVDRNVAAGTGITLNIGGANSDPSIVLASFVAGNAMWIKAGTYVITTASTNTAGGCLLVNVVGTEASATKSNIEGYSTTRGDLGAAPVLQVGASVSSATILATGVNGYFHKIRNLTLDGNAQTASIGLHNASGYCYVRLVVAINCRSYGIRDSAGLSSYISCRAVDGQGTAGISLVNGSHASACVATGNTCTGFALDDRSFTTYCLSYANSGASSDGFALSEFAPVMNCVAYGNGRHGFFCNASFIQFGVNNIAEGNSGYGFAASGAAHASQFLNCVTYNNTSGAHDSNLTITEIAASGSVFTNAAAGDFSLNNTASAGALARATGLPGVFPLGLTTGYLDIGAAQHADPASSGGYVPQVFE